MLEERLRGMPPGAYTVCVNPRAVSQMTGQKKCNLSYFREKGYAITVKPDDVTGRYEITVKRDAP